MGDVLGPGVIADLRKVVQDLATPDRYEIRRPEMVDDGVGGLKPTGNILTVESGRCLLAAAGYQPDERLIAERLEYRQPYVVRNLPVTTVLTTADTLVVNGRSFQVGGIARGGAWEVSVTAICEEAGLSA